MPRYDPTIIPSEQLEQDIIDFNTQIMILNYEINHDLNIWANMIRSDLPQEQLDKQEKQCKSKSKKRNMLMNKKFKINAEIMSRL